MGSEGIYKTEHTPMVGNNLCAVLWKGLYITTVAMTASQLPIPIGADAPHCRSCKPMTDNTPFFLWHASMDADGREVLLH